jgi:hypothetical protein
VELPVHSHVPTQSQAAASNADTSRKVQSYFDYAGDFLAYEPKRGLSRRTLAFVIPSVFLIGIILTATLLARFITPQPGLSENLGFILILRG